MNDQHRKTNTQSGINPVAAVVAGAVVGAGIVAAGVAMKDEKNREKVGAVLNDVKGKAVAYVEDLKSSADDTKQKAEGKFVEGKDAVKKVAAETKKSVEQGIKDVKKAA